MIIPLNPQTYLKLDLSGYGAASGWGRQRLEPPAAGAASGWSSAMLNDGPDNRFHMIHFGGITYIITHPVKSPSSITATTWCHG